MTVLTVNYFWKIEKQIWDKHKEFMLVKGYGFARRICDERSYSYTDLYLGQNIIVYYMGLAVFYFGLFTYGFM